jgi:chemotaxis protein methyltransferase CheR
VNREIHDRVCWTNANLLREEEIAPLAVSHVIFCRNVFIYFQPGNIRKVVQTFARYMLPPAYLFVGAPESLVRLTTQFELQEIGNAFAYLRSDRGEKAWIA